MGCISSKDQIAPTMSIREEMNRKFQSKSAAWEEILLSSHGDNDHLFALVCSSNNMTTKLRSSSFTLPSTDIQTTTLDHLREVETIPHVDAVEEPYSSRFTRSRSCQTLSDDGLIENKLDLKDKNVAGSRSFHTVEEFDALLDRIHKWGVVDETCESGWKRKAVAKGLKALDVPSIDFPVIGRFRQREGQVCSPGNYVTPKFGSYNIDKVVHGRKDKDCGERSIFSPELLAAFEDCMQQLQEEEDSILRRMNEYRSNDDEEKDDKVGANNDIIATDPLSNQ